MMNKQLSEKKLAFGSFSLGFFAVVPTVNMIINRAGNMGEEAMLVPLYTIALLLIGISSVRCHREIKRPYNSFWIILCAVLVTFVLSKVYKVNSALTPVFFWLYTVISFLIPQLLVPDVKRMLRYMIILPSFGVFFLSQVFALRDSGAIGMDLTYSFLVPIVSSIVYMFSYLKEDKGSIRYLMIITIGINLLYFIYCFLWGSRAPVLSVILCLIFMQCTKATQEKLGYKIKRSSFLWTIATLVFVFFFDSILYSLSNLFKTLNFDAYSIDKMLMLYEMNDLSDGRASINMLSWVGIKDSPVWGHGISASERFTNHTYPHNFLLQLLLDGGIILFLLVMIPMVYKLAKLKKNGSYEEYVLLTALFFGSIPGALFSLDMWANSRLWLFMGFLHSSTFSFYYKKYNKLRKKL